MKANKKFRNVYAVDWGHKKEHEAWYDVTNNKSLDSKPKLKRGDIVLVENIPTYIAKDFTKLGVIILTCHTMASKEHRDELGIPRLKHYKHEGHTLDASVIEDLYQKKPHLFHEWKPNEVKLQYGTFIQIQKARVAATLREWSIEAKDNGNRTIEFLKKAEEETVKAMDSCDKGDIGIVYDYVQNIPYIGPRTGGGVVGLADAAKFETASKLRKYAGLSVINGGIQHFVAGESSGYSPDLKALLIKRIGDGIIKSSGRPKISAYFMDYTIEKERLQKLPSRELSIGDKKNIIGDLIDEELLGFKKGKRIYKHTYPKLKKVLEKLGRNIVLIKLSDGHIHNRAIRKTAQLFLEDYWVISRQLRGFSTVPPYAITVKKHVHYRLPRYIPKILEPFDSMRETGWIFKEEKRPWSEAEEYIKDQCGMKPEQR